MADNKISFCADTVFLTECNGFGYIVETVFFVHERKRCFTRAFYAKSDFAQPYFAKLRENSFSSYKVFRPALRHDPEIGKSSFDHHVADFFCPPDVGEKVRIPDFQKFFVFRIVQEGDLFNNIFSASPSPAFMHLVIGAKRAAPGASP